MRKVSLIMTLAVMGLHTGLLVGVVSAGHVVFLFVDSDTKKKPPRFGSTHRTDPSVLTGELCLFASYAAGSPPGP